MQDFSLQITKSRKSVQRNEERVREGEKRIALWKLPPLVEIRKPSGFPQRLGKHKTLSTVPTRPTCILFFKTLREARSTLNTLLFGPKDGEHLTARAFETFSARLRSTTGSSVSVGDESNSPTVLSEFLSNSRPADVTF